jgi:NAD(P)-dependent dehydrogenase (short-subunit alcohol dehydrogenase family)
MSAAERTVEMITEYGGVAVAFDADVTVDTDCEAMVEKALALWGRLDVLDNNVGVGSRGSVVDESPSQWRRVMKINVESIFLASKIAIPAMIATGAGVIVNVSSIAAMRPRGMTAYSTSKSAIIGLTQAMAVDHGPEGIRVNCVAVGINSNVRVKRNRNSAVFRNHFDRTFGGTHPPIDNQYPRTSVREEQCGRPTVANPIVTGGGARDDGIGNGRPNTPLGKCPSRKIPL